jgi:hypothetical protein
LPRRSHRGRRDSRTINDGIRSIDGVLDKQTFMHLRTEKNDCLWGRRLAEQ